MSSPHNGERPRFFDAMAKKLCWAKADTVAGRHPDRWRKDAAGNVVCKRFCNCQGCLCFEYDHIRPFAKGGESVVENCQILQTRVNRLKSDKDHLEKTQLRGYSCDISFTERSIDPRKARNNRSKEVRKKSCASKFLTEGTIRRKRRFLCLELPVVARIAVYGMPTSTPIVLLPSRTDCCSSPILHLLPIVAPPIVLDRTMLPMSLTDDVVRMGTLLGVGNLDKKLMESSKSSAIVEKKPFDRKKKNFDNRFGNKGLGKFYNANTSG
ncbi:hypothetical protein E3N88_41502 [Mikania micrantha]|uniref:HNH domain-containing protein n=1 Tax=Mikania micrantha TaxID=192012 RepID=A0A5N6LKF7_9ASTR|nr:hypothetical protein E3N88_41502 [Mikania micrantha]